jgi:hypothetical protein
MADEKLHDPIAFEADARRELRRSPKVWAWETSRLALYVLGRVVFAPWCLVWPAVTVWLIWWGEDVGAKAAIQIFAAGPDRTYAWIYVLGAIFHSLAIVGSDPYEWEIDRRVRAQVLNYSTRTRWIRRPDPVRASAPIECAAPKGWERVEAGSAVS